MAKVYCGTCDQRAHCISPCAAVNQILWANNRVMEKQYAEAVVVYPQTNEVHMSAVHPARLKALSEDDAFPWSGTDTRLTKTAVFVERFFHKTPCKELAERFNVEENTIITMYHQAVEQIGHIIEALDARREGLKATKAGPFTPEQRMFLLVCVFGFNRVEVARMFKREHKSVCKTLKRMTEQYRAMFAGNGSNGEHESD